MLSAVLFDLDGTLLDIDIDGFLGDYFGALGPVVASVLGDAAAPEAGLRAVIESTEAMVAPHPDITNQAAFNMRFRELTGVDLDLDEYALPFERFYAEVFPTLRKGLGPREGAREAVETALSLGLKVAIATNPIFPRSAILERMRWAGVHDLDVDVVTTYECMHAAKPLAAYFEETARLLAVAAEECLMVGDDPVLDLGAARAGMRVFYVGAPPLPVSDFSGDLADVTRVIRDIAAETV